MLRQACRVNDYEILQFGQFRLRKQHELDSSPRLLREEWLQEPLHCQGVRKVPARLNCSPIVIHRHLTATTCNFNRYCPDGANPDIKGVSGDKWSPIADVKNEYIQSVHGGAGGRLNTFATA